jgi:hypothetical protein
MTITETPLFFKGEVIGTATVCVEDCQAKAVELPDTTILTIRNVFLNYFKTVLIECKEREVNEKKKLEDMPELAFQDEMVKMGDESFLAGEIASFDATIELLDKIMEYDPKESP